MTVWATSLASAIRQMNEKETNIKACTQALMVKSQKQVMRQIRQMEGLTAAVHMEIPEFKQ